MEVAEAMDIPVRDGDEPLTLAGRLRKVPRAFERFVSTITRQYVGHVLGLVKSYWPTTRLDALGQGARADFQKIVSSVFGEDYASGRSNCGVLEQGRVFLNFSCN